ncbi:MAG: hypothetical protein H0W83_04015 [Planctomycetes bacterium]|nr:hypothetical protein [Planctomycetota bacterium]
MTDRPIAARIHDALDRLAPHLEALKRHFVEENRKFSALMAVDHDQLGRILKAHLIVESYLQRYLEHELAVPGLDAIRLSFFQKAMLIADGSAAGFIKPSLVDLNSIRNAYAHRVDASITLGDMPNIIPILRAARSEDGCVTVVDHIEAFTAVACAFLSIAPEGIRSVFDQAFAGLDLGAGE